MANNKKYCDFSGSITVQCHCDKATPMIPVSTKAFSILYVQYSIEYVYAHNKFVSYIYDFFFKKNHCDFKKSLYFWSYKTILVFCINYVFKAESTYFYSSVAH